MHNGVFATARGRQKMALNGFLYTKKRQQKNRVRWACSQRAAYTGKGAVTTSLQVKGQLKLMSQGRRFVVVADVLRLYVRQWSYTSQQSNKRWGLLQHLRQSPPIYPPRMWNLHTATLTGVEKTDNVCEGGTIRSTRWLGGHQHPARWTLLGALQQDEAMLQPPSCSTPEASCRQNVRSTPPCSSSSACTICAAAVVTAQSLLLTRFVHWDIASDCSRVVRGRPYDSGSYYKLLTPMMPLFVDLLLF